MSDNWLPIESNPEVLNDYLKTLGFDTSQFAFTDLFSTEDWAKEMVPKPVLGMLLVFPYNDKFKDFRAKEKAEIAEKGQFVDPDLFFMKQFASNACGSVGIYHILGNLQGEYAKLLDSDSIVNKFISQVKDKNAEARGEAFTNAKNIREAHVSNVDKGVTQVVEKVDSHFVALTSFNGTLYEFDGTKDFPINHGKTTEGTFIDDACNVAQKFMERDPDNLGFSLVVLAKQA